MKKISLVFVSILISAVVFSQQNQTKTTVQNQQTIKLTSRADTVQYTIGAYIGQWMVKNGFSITNPVMFNRGMNDVLQKKPLALPDSVIGPMVTSFQLIVQNARSRQMEEQLFAALKGKPGVGVLPDGINYIVLKTGAGTRPTAADSITINAIGMLPDGTIFEDTFKKKKPITTQTGKLIPGLNETVQLMPEGSTWRIFIPSVLGYGPAGLTNIIPPNSALVFEISLLQVKTNKK